MRFSSRVRYGIVLLGLASFIGLALQAGSAPALTIGAHTLRADDEILHLVSEAGFDAVVQVFAWREIEPRQGDWYWEYPDFVLRAADHYDTAVIARLDQQPYWATDPETETVAPPDHLADYAEFAQAVARRYAGRLKGYVIWNEPNLAREWGNRLPDPAAYTEMLCSAYRAIKAVDSQAVVVSAGLAPTNDQNAEALDDRVFLERMYRAGARECFDVLGVHAYGFGQAPDDVRGAHQGLNLARVQDLREVMIVHGDASRPVWVTELGWTTHNTGRSRVASRLGAPASRLPRRCLRSDRSGLALGTPGGDLECQSRRPAGR